MYMYNMHEAVSNHLYMIHRIYCCCCLLLLFVVVYCCCLLLLLFIVVVVCCCCLLLQHKAAACNRKTVTEILCKRAPAIDMENKQ